MYSVVHMYEITNMSQHDGSCRFRAFDDVCVSWVSLDLIIGVSYYHVASSVQNCAGHYGIISKLAFRLAGGEVKNAD